MAFLVTDDSWSGLYSEYLITRAMFSMDTLKKGICAVQPGVKKIYTIERWDLQNALNPSQATPTTTPEEGFSNTVRTITPGNFQMYEVFNPRDLEKTIYAKGLADQILNETVPAGSPYDLQARMVQLALSRSGESIETMFWQGSTAYQGNCVQGSAEWQIQYFNGFCQIMVNDPDVNKSTISPVAITTSNVIAILDDLISQTGIKKQALISDENTKDDMRWLMSVQTCVIYQAALRINAYKGLALDEWGIPMYGGWKVERLAGMPQNTIIFGRAGSNPLVSNFHIAMNSASDWNLKVNYKDGNPMNEEWAMLAKWKMAVNIGWPDELFWYTTLTAADFEA